MSAISFRRKGQSIIETVVGIMFLVPIVLFLFDIAVLVLCNTANDNLAKSVCRAAASATNNSGTGDASSAKSAALAVANTFATSAIIKQDGGTFLKGISYNGAGWDGSDLQAQGQNPPPQSLNGQVACVTKMRIVVPVPFPFLPNQVDFYAKDVEPIVSISP